MPEWSIGTVSKTVVPFTGTQGSNPCLSANNKDKTAVSQRLAAVLILYTYKNTYKLKENPVSGFSGGRGRCQEYSVASLNMKNLMSPTPRN